MLTIEKRKVNEKWFLNMIKNKTKFYMWIDTGNCYDLSSGKMKPHTLKGYVQLSQIVRKEFMMLFVEKPDVIA